MSTINSDISPATVAPITVNTSDGSTNNGNKSVFSRRQRNRTGDIFRDTLNKTFDGAESKVGAVLGLTVEKIDKKAPFTQFRDKMINYVGRERPMGDMLTCIIKDGSDP